MDGPDWLLAKLDTKRLTWVSIPDTVLVMRLSDWLRENKHTHATFGRLIGRSAITVGRYARGERIPDKDTALAIHDATKQAVRPDDFYGIGSAA